MPKTGGLSLANVPRPDFPLRRRRRPFLPCVFATSGWPLWPATTEASSHSTSLDSVTVGFFLRSLHARQSSSVGHRCHPRPALGQCVHSTNSTPYNRDTTPTLSGV